MYIRHLFLFFILHSSFCILYGCSESHLTMTTDAGPMPVPDDAYIATGHDSGYYVWPDSSLATADSGPAIPDDAYTAPDAYVAPLGHYEFCGDTPQHIGFAGCCATDGVFPTADHAAPGMLIKGSGHTVYYVASDNRRYVFPTSHQLASWFLDPSRDLPFGQDAFACSQVVQIPDAELAAISIGGNVTYRPGVITTGITTDPKRYVIDHGGTLRWIEDVTFDLHQAEPWLRGRDVYIADAFFVNYCIGLQAQSSWPERGYDAYNGAAIYAEATLDSELLHYCSH